LTPLTSMQELSTVERHKEAVAGDGFGLGIAFSDRLLDETHRLTLLSPATQGEQSKPAPPAFILETDGPFGAGLGHRHQSVASRLFLSYKESGEVIQRFALCHLSPRRRESVARMVSPETRLLVILSSKATSAAISQGSRGYSGGQTPLESGVASRSRPRRFSHRKRREFAEDVKI
jgi:hypothetical protein